MAPAGADGISGGNEVWMSLPALQEPLDTNARRTDSAPAWRPSTARYLGRQLVIEPYGCPGRREAWLYV